MPGSILLPALILAAAANAPQVSTLTTALPAFDVAVTDLNGDGKADVLAVCADPEAEPIRKAVEVFLAGENGTYPERASLTLTLNPSVGTVFLAETDGKAPAELVAGNARGATIFSYRDGRFDASPPIAFASLWPSRVKKPAFLTYGAFDLTGDGIDEWLIPTPSGFAIRTRDGALAEVPCDVVGRITSSYTISHRLPIPIPFAMPGQATKSVAFLGEEYVDFAYGDRWTGHRRYEVPLDRQDKWEASTEMKDIDGNGLPDLIVTQMQGKVNVKVLTEIYLASEPFVYPKEPTARFQFSGALTAPMLEDLNGDGKSDLLFLKVPLGVKLFVNYFVMQKLTIQAEVHLFNGTTFNEAPDFRDSITVEAPEQRERPAYVMGDFSGDGHTDVAFSASQETMAIYTGSEERFMSSKPWTTLTLPSYGQARAYDLDGSGGMDIVLFHPDGNDKTRIDVAVF
jgi:hypothetical protein